MACEKAIVASKVGGLPEQIEEGKSGLLFNEGSSSELAKKVDSLLSDEERRRRFGKEARKRVEELFTSDIMARKSIEVYNTVAG
jgi:starch synthase